ncbi:MAG: ribonuclease J, partial [Kamptonema sp. SIO4C4]|nr:ribonuclease J [Kamptonema sp. SIO4C4]
TCHTLTRRNIPDEKALILTTGSQGETLAAMTRIAKGEHRHIQIKKGDTVVFSANPIPGNTLAVCDTIDRLMMKGAEVIYGRHHGIHVSGHGSQEDHKLMLALTKPKFFVPVHGQYRMLVKHARMAHKMGIPEENTVIIDNGDIVEVSSDRIQIAGQVPSGIQFVDNAGVIHDGVMEERQQLAEDGAVTVAAAVDRDLQLLANPEVHLRGVACTMERSLFQQLVVRNIERILSEQGQEFIRNSKGKVPEVDWVGLKNELEKSIERLARRELRCRPLVVFLLQNPEDQTQHTSPVKPTSPKSKPQKSAAKAGSPTTVNTPRRRKRSTASAAS